MTLFKIEDTLSERRPGLTRADILKMPFYELALKLNIIKEKDEERAKDEGKQQSEQQTTFNPERMMQQQLKNVNFKPDIKLPTKI